MYRGHEKHVIVWLLAGVESTSYFGCVLAKGVLSNMCQAGFSSVLSFFSPPPIVFSMASSPAKEASVQPTNGLT
jgi:hypothetical protein